MKILCIGDPHIKLDNITDFDLFENKLHALIDSEHPDLIVVLGDVLHYHEKLYTQNLNNAFNFLKRLGEKSRTYVLVGNHDMINNQQFLTTNHWMNSIKSWESANILVVDNVEYIKDGQDLFVFCPYVYPGRFREALDTCSEDWKRADVIFAHQEFKGCKMGAIISEHGDEWSDDLPFVISGHIHQKQYVGENVFYTGSAMQHAFGESEENVICILDNDFTIREIDLGLPRKRIVNVENISKIDTDRIVSSKDNIRLNVVADKTEIKEFRKSLEYSRLVDAGVKIVFKESKKDRVAPENQRVEYDFKSILKGLVNGDDKMRKMYNKFVE